MERADAVLDSGQARLEQLGYKQELRRALSHFNNFAVMFAVSSILAGITSSFSIGYTRGGPVVVIWTWVFVFVLNLATTSSLAEICSSFPMAGGMFSWSYQLGGRYSRLACWLTGWMSLTGWVAGTTSAAFACVYIISTMVYMATAGDDGQGFTFSQAQQLGMVAAVLVAQGAINVCSNKVMVLLSHVAVVWNILGTLTLIILLPSIAKEHQTAKFVFTYFAQDSPGYAVSDWYTVLLGVLFAVYCLSGFDVGSHLSEETRRADKAPRMMVLSLVASFLLGLAFLLTILFSMQNVDATELETGAAAGFIVVQIFYDIFQSRFGTGTGAIIVSGIPMLAIFLGGVGSVMTSSRILWAFAREGGVPYSQLCRKVHRDMGMPVNAVIASTGFSILLALPLLRNITAFYATISIAILGGATSFLIPISLKLLVARDTFQPGPFNLGIFSRPVNAFACLAILFVMSLAVLPTAFPITMLNFNYAPVAWGIMMVITMAVWFLPMGMGAHSWFKIQQQSLLDNSSADAAPTAASDPKLGLLMEVPKI